MVPFHSRIIDRDLWVSVSFDRVCALNSNLSSSNDFQSGIEPEESILDDPDSQDVEHEVCTTIITNMSPLLIDCFNKILM